MFGSQTGAQEWGLDTTYCDWLNALPSVETNDRGDEYYTSVEGDRLKAWPKKRVGDASQRRRSRNREGSKGA